MFMKVPILNLNVVLEGHVERNLLKRVCQLDRAERTSCATLRRQPLTQARRIAYLQRDRVLGAREHVSDAALGDLDAAVTHIWSAARPQVRFATSICTPSS